MCRLHNEAEVSSNLEIRKSGYLKKRAGSAKVGPSERQLELPLELTLINC